jgi:hypothetical protein
MSQIQQPKLTECNRCKANGFPGQMITFQKHATKKKDDGRPFWLLLNGDMTGHEHVQPGSTGLQKIQNIENEKPPARPIMHEQVDSGAIITRLERIENALNLLALSNIATTEEERMSLRARLWDSIKTQAN